MTESLRQQLANERSAELERANRDLHTLAATLEQEIRFKIKRGNVKQEFVTTSYSSKNEDYVEFSLSSLRGAQQGEVRQLDGFEALKAAARRADMSLGNPRDHASYTHHHPLECFKIFINIAYERSPEARMDAGVAEAVRREERKLRVRFRTWSSRRIEAKRNHAAPGVQQVARQITIKHTGPGRRA